MNPFSGAINAAPDLTPSYRGFLIAKIVARFNPTDGPFAGKNVYTWTEQSMTIDGGDEDALPSPREGTYTSSTSFDNLLVDVNDTVLSPGQFVWARMKGSVGGATVYETISFPSPSSSSASYCASDAWLKYLGDSSTTCWTFYEHGGSGRCSCFPSEDETTATTGIDAVYVSGLTGWLGVKARSTGGSAMPATCCGCGSGLLKIMSGSASGSRASMTLGGVHVSCQGSPATTFSETLTDYCTGTLADGRRYILFFGSSADACSGTVAPCDNTYMVMAVCGADCPTSACGCTGCGNNPTPIAFYSLGISGFTDNANNGDWIWTYSGTGCDYAASCNGSSSTLTFDPAAGTNGQWILSHGGSEYRKDYASTDCGSAMTLNRTTGTDGPLSITITPVSNSTGSCCSGCAEIPTTTLLTVTFTNKTGTCSCLPDSLGMTYNGATSRWEANSSFTCPQMECEENATFELECVDGIYCAGTGAIGPGAHNPVSVQCSPLVLVYDITTPWGGTYRATITE